MSSAWNRSLLIAICPLSAVYQRKGLQRIQRFWWREKPAISRRLAFFDDGGFEIREYYIALQQWSRPGDEIRRVNTSIGPNHRLAGERDAEGRRLCQEGRHDCIDNDRADG